eukprot:COSAG02_NODE_3409_length_6790_cov_149.811239_1_plen_110_part_00
MELGAGSRCEARDCAVQNAHLSLWHRGLQQWSCLLVSNSRTVAFDADLDIVAGYLRVCQARSCGSGAAGFDDGRRCGHAAGVTNGDASRRPERSEKGVNGRVKTTLLDG